MKRYQMYLDPIEVNILDKIAQLASVPRSQIVRDLVSTITQRYVKLIPEINRRQNKIPHPFNKYLGKFKLDDPKAFLNIDEIYLRD